MSIQELLAHKLTKEVFDEVDTVHSGAIEKNELKEALMKIAMRTSLRRR